MEASFLLQQLIQLILLYSIHYGNGLLVKFKGFKVNYTRKMNHFMYFFIPLLLPQVFEYQETPDKFIISALMAIFTLVIYIKPIRGRVPAISTMFLSFDRPEDRPYTLIWLISQIIVGYIVVIPMVVLYYNYNLLHLLMIPVFINGMGDGLAEPVGVRFGNHKYRVHALFTRRKYVRSLEGSACVFLTSLVTLIVYYEFFSTWQFVTALLVLPFLMTLTEALSPHTWDQPFLFLVGYLVLFGVSFI